ncbi:MAG: serine hydrolase [Candidatus Eisenbacteria bacterium]|nr:serine hydrolase [Candidatus Eisenbacteria bacterium]
MRRFVSVLILLALVPPPRAGADPATEKDVTGIWRGIILARDVEIDLYWRVYREGESGLRAYYDSPLYGIKDVPVPEVRLVGDRVDMAVGMFPSSFSGRWIAPDRIEGSFRVEGDPLPMTLERIRRDPEAVLPYRTPRLDGEGRPVLRYTYRVPEAVPGDWVVGDASEEGLDEERLERLVERVLAGAYPNLHSILVVRGGRLVFEEYFYGYDAAKPHPIYSNAKGLIATSIAVALDRGEMTGLHQHVAEFFPEHASLFDEEGKREMTIEHLLAMTAGFEWDELSYSYYDDRNTNRRMQQCPDRVAFLLGLPLADPPGTRFVYNSGLPVLLGEILRKATGMHVWAYAEEHLFRPLGFQRYLYEYAADGTAGGVLLRPRDFVKVPRLYLNRGLWEGRRIAPASWFDRCGGPGRECPSSEYWNHWGRSVLFVDGSPVLFFSGGGFGGQAIFGFPDLDLVVAMTGGNYFTPSVDQHEILRRYILAPIKDSAIKYDPPDPAVAPDYVGLHGLEWRETFFTDLGALWGCADYLGFDFSESRLYGTTGYAFLLNAAPSIPSNCLGLWDKRRFEEILRAAGLEVATYASHVSQPSFDAIRAAAWDSVRTAIENGTPAYGFHMNLPESYVVYGVDGRGYYYKGVDCRTGYGPRCRDEVAGSDPGWFEMHTVRRGAAEPAGRVAEAALAYALELNRKPEEYCYRGFDMGPGAYVHWRTAMETGEGDAFGIAYTAAGWAVCRRNAVGYLQEVRQVLPEACAASLSEAEARYRNVSECWNEIATLFPYSGVERAEMTAHWKSAERRARAEARLAEASKEEALGLDAIEEALKILKKGGGGSPTR